MCLAQGPQRSYAGEARTRGPSVASQALLPLSHCAPCECLLILSLPGKALRTLVVIAR